MKIKILILIHVILIAFNANGQVMDSIIEKIISEELIAEKDGSELKKLVEKSYYEEEAAYVDGLLKLQYKEVTGQTEIGFGSFLSFGHDKMSEKERNELNEVLTEYITKLKNCNLVTDRQFQKISFQIDNNDFIHPLQILTDVIHLIEYDKRMSPEKLKVFSKKLSDNEICTGENINRLNEDIEKRLLDNPIEFLKYCDKSFLFELDKYSDEPDEYIEKIHRETASLVNGLDFEDFKYEIQLNKSISDSKYKSYNLIVSLKCNGKTYKQKSFYSPLEKRDKEGMMRYFGKIGTQEYYNIFNKILADNQSSYRLHEVKSTVKNAADYSKFGIIALTRAQAKVLHGSGVYFRPSYENFKNNLTSNSIANAIKEYQKIGLFDHLTEKEINESIRKIEEQENYNFNNILASFPDIIHWFDMELGNLENPYFELVEEYSKISHGEFNPIHILDNFDIQNSTSCTLSFKLGEKEYSKKLVIEGDWMDGHFFEFIDRVVSENNLNGEFYSLYEGGQGAMIIYLTKKQYDHLRKNKLVVFPDEWESQE